MTNAFFMTCCMSSAWTSWRKAEWRTSKGEVYYETGEAAPADPEVVRSVAPSVPIERPSISPYNSVPGCPETTRFVPPVVEVAVLRCGNATPWDRSDPGAMNEFTLSRCRHGFEPRWDCAVLV
jgi:hypothetical protein